MNKLIPKIRKEYEVSKIHEISVDWNGWNYLVIYGKHINGWFIAIPNHGVCIESARPSDYLYNSEKLAKSFDSFNAGTAIAKAISEHWEGLNED